MMRPPSNYGARVDPGDAASGAASSTDAPHSAANGTRSARSPAKIKIRRRYHFHRPLLVYGFVTLLVALGAFQSNNNLLFWLFGLALALLIVSGFLSGAMLMGIRVERLPTSAAERGRPATIRYRVRNVNRFVPAFAMQLTDIADGDPGPQPAADADTNGARTDSARTNGARTNAAMLTGTVHPGVAAPPGVKPDAPIESFVPHVAARGEIIVEATLRASHRGAVHLRTIQLATQFPFGIVRKSLQFDTPADVLVRPAPAPIPDRLARWSGLARAHAETASSAVGPSDQFHALREYVPGDSLRSIAWKPSARLGELRVRQTTAAAPARAALVLELASAPDEAAYEHAIDVAAALVHAAERRAVALGLLVPATGLSVPPRTGRWHGAVLLNDLAALPGFDALRSTLQRPAGARAPLGADWLRTAACTVLHAGRADDNGYESARHLSALDLTRSSPSVGTRPDAVRSGETTA